jgi:predicted alpha-1,6-mannanase (GH76 family)
MSNQIRRNKLTKYYYLTVLLSVVIICASCNEVERTMDNKNQKVETKAIWEERADLAQAALVQFYWNEEIKLFNNWTPCNDVCNNEFNYWWQAHAVDTLVDGLERTGDVKYKSRLADFHQGLLDRNGGNWPNDFYDDMEWMALAWLRAYQFDPQDKYKQTVLELWKDIQSGWNEQEGGGIAWKKSQLDYKNTPANAPAAILAARLYQQFGDDKDLQWAVKIYQWQKANLVDPVTGIVWDGKNRQGDGQIDKNWQLSYCQGVFIGAALELYRMTKDKTYLDDITRVVHATKEKLVNPATGTLPDEGDRDGGLFKGILIRYLGELILQVPTQDEARQILFQNAESLWTKARDPLRNVFSQTWTAKPEIVVELSTNLSGVMLLEQMAMAEKNGILVN